ncbi:DUF1513 domain-containing protein [Parvibaculaceae bacterium PLY_AMNH_Bact1]|nr:DUF1513 domain-containing protein [Parvibaculaceae bacterium PLY_AMNH_Bact1]
MTAAPLPVIADDAKTRWMGCRQVDDTHFATLFDDTGHVHLDVQLPGRGHGILPSSDGQRVAIMARRPDRFALVVDLSTGDVLHQLTASAGHHFYGHGCFSSDGTLFYTSENHYETGNGVIGVRDANKGFELLGHFASGGIGPHEILLTADGKSLAIANGGIRTHPDTDRSKLNLETMAPSLTFVDSTTGELASRHTLDPEHHQLSIRHLATGPNGIAAALQYEGPKRNRVPLLALFDGSHLTLADTPTTVAKAMRNYAGSVTFDASGEIIALTCPRGNLVSFWSSDDGTYLGAHTARDVCGIAPLENPGHFALTAGAITFQATLATTKTTAQFADTQWDNHLVAIA